MYIYFALSKHEFLGMTMQSMETAAEGYYVKYVKLYYVKLAYLVLSQAQIIPIYLNVNNVSRISFTSDTFASHVLLSDVFRS